MTTTRARWFNAILHRGPGYQLPSQTETDLRAALADLASRWERMAERAPDLGDDLFIDAPSPTVAAQVERARIYRQAAADVRDVLRTGHAPHGLMTDAELEQYGTPEATS